MLYEVITHRLPEDLRATASVEEAVRDADVVVVGVPSHGFRSVLEEVKRFIRPWVPPEGGGGPEYVKL